MEFLGGIRQGFLQTQKVNLLIFGYLTELLSAMEFPPGHQPPEQRKSSLEMAASARCAWRHIFWLACATLLAAAHVSSSLSSSPVRNPADPLEFLAVADLDHASLIQDGGGKKTKTWKSVLKRGQLTRDPTSGNFTLSWIDAQEVSTQLSRKDRGMELSSLVTYGGALYSVCDYSGVLYRILGAVGSKPPIAIPEHVLVDGPDPGDPSYAGATKGMKAEWSTVKDGELVVGSIGKEWTNSAKEVLHRGPEWVKVIDANGAVRSVDWGQHFRALRSATGSSFPGGYLWHEAVHWHPEGRKWIVMPRKASTNIPYSPKADEVLGSNLLLVASEDWSEIEVKQVGPREPLYGFTAVRQLPGIYTLGIDGAGSDEEETGDKHLFVALKVKERETEADGVVTHTKLAVFDLSGKFYTDPPFLHVSDEKYEGLEFVTATI